MSGEPGRFLQFSRYRNPSFDRIRRSSSSGFVPSLLILLMIRLRWAVVKVSAITILAEESVSSLNAVQKLAPTAAQVEPSDFIA